MSQLHISPVIPPDPGSVCSIVLSPVSESMCSTSKPSLILMAYLYGENKMISVREVMYPFLHLPLVKGITHLGPGGN